MAKQPGERFASYDDFIMAMTAARSELLVEIMRAQQVQGGKGHHGKGWWKR